MLLLASEYNVQITLEASSGVIVFSKDWDSISHSFKTLLMTARSIKCTIEMVRRKNNYKIYCTLEYMEACISKSSLFLYLRNFSYILGDINSTKDLHVCKCTKLLDIQVQTPKKSL